MSAPCRRVWDALESGETLETGGAEALREHALGCAHCRPALPLLPAARASAELRRHSLASGPGPAVRVELQRTAGRRTLPWAWAVAGFVGVAGLCALLGVAALSHGAWVGNRSSPQTVLALLGALGTGVALAGFTALAPSATTARKLLLPLAAGLVAWVVLGGSGFQPGGSFTQGALRCAASEVATGLIPFALALFLLTGFSPRPLQSFSAGLAAAFAGMAMLHVHCPNGTPAHLFVGHVLPAAALGLSAWGLRLRLPSRSFAP